MRPQVSLGSICLGQDFVSRHNLDRRPSQKHHHPSEVCVYLASCLANKSLSMYDSDAGRRTTVCSIYVVKYLCAWPCVYMSYVYVDSLSCLLSRRMRYVYADSLSCLLYTTALLAAPSSAVSLSARRPTDVARASPSGSAALGMVYLWCMDDVACVRVTLFIHAAQ